MLLGPFLGPHLIWTREGGAPFVKHVSPEPAHLLLVEGLGGQLWPGPTRLGFMGGGHLVALYSISEAQFLFLHCLRLLQGSMASCRAAVGWRLPSPPPEGATGSHTQLALGHSVWPQTAWLPAPAWESPHELWSEECDCGKPNALGQ